VRATRMRCSTSSRCATVHERPRLKRGSARRLRRVAVGEFADVSEPCGIEVGTQRREKMHTRRFMLSASRNARFAPRVQPGFDERPHQPWPDGTLMISAIALQRRSAVPAGDRSERRPSGVSKL
jgi:hypothetical protein